MADQCGVDAILQADTVTSTHSGSGPMKIDHQKSSAQSKSGSPSDKPYIPAVGDVVTDGEDIGLIFKTRGSLFWLAFRESKGIDSYSNAESMLWLSAERDALKVIGKIESQPTTWTDAYKALKAYFSASTFTGSYEERQAQAVKHYGWKEGSKVKVVREFGANEDGSHCTSYDGYGGKAEMQGEVCEIEAIQDDCIWLYRPDKSTADDFPYCALEPV